LYRQTAIVGIGHTDYSRNSGRTELVLALDAIIAALKDANIAPEEVDGIVRYAYDNVTQAALVRALGIKDLRWYSDIPFGGIAQCGTIAQAAAAIVSGIAETVIVFRSLNERSGVRYGRAERSIGTNDDLVQAAGGRIPAGQFAGPYGLLAPGQVHALWARRYIHEAGLDDEIATSVFARVAIDQRRYANNNPHAMMKSKALDTDTYMAGRMISEPLRLYDYCLETDGAAALVITSAERARALRPDPVYILAAHQCLFPYSEPLPVYPALANFGAPGNIRKLYEDARLQPEDISVAELYDVTTFGIVYGLETYGFAPFREGWRHVHEQGIGLDSAIPVNTHGGHLSEAYIHGMNHLVEAVRQLRGTAPNQVRGAETALVGCAGSSSAILAR